MVYDKDVKYKLTNNNLSKIDSRILVGRKSNSAALIYDINEENKLEIPWSKYQIKETDMRIKTASFTTPVKFDLTDAVHIVQIISSTHEKFVGEILSQEYKENSDGSYTYQCQDFSREYQSKMDLISTNNDLYRILQSLITGLYVQINETITKEKRKQFSVLWSGLRPKQLYDQKLWNNPVSFNPMTEKPKIIIRDKTYIEAIRELVFGTGAFIDIYFNSRGIIQIEPFNADEWKSNGLWLSTEELMSRNFKFDTTNAITHAYIQSSNASQYGRVYSSAYLLNLNLAVFFGTLIDSASNPVSNTVTTPVKIETPKSTNPYGKKKMKAWINADSGSDNCKKLLANELKKAGWSVHISGTGPGYHYRDYFNVTKDYQVLIQIFNGFCAGTIREAYSKKIQNVLKNKGVVLVNVFDTHGWTNPKGMKPYRYGDFSKYSARRAWDDNFSSSDPSIKNVGDFFKKNNAIYCASPTINGIMKQFSAGGYFKYKDGSSNNTSQSRVEYIPQVAVNLEGEKAKARELIQNSSRDFLSLKLTLPLGNKYLRYVHTNQFLFTELPQEFDLANWTGIAEILSSSYTRYAGYTVNRWYIEGVTIDVDAGNKAEMTLDLNAFASSISEYKEGYNKMREAYTNATTSKTSTATKNSVQKNTGLVVSKTVENKYSPTLINLVKKIVGNEKNKLKMAKLIHQWLVNNVRYSRYCCGKYGKDPLKAYNNRKHLNCADTALLSVALFRIAGITADVVHHSRSGGHFWARLTIDGKYYHSDASDYRRKWNEVWKGKTYDSVKGEWCNCGAYNC